MKIYIVVFVFYVHVQKMSQVEIDYIDCGIDDSSDVKEGPVPDGVYPWLGILYYTYYGELGESRAVTTVALVQAEFVIAVSADIDPMPKNDFRSKARVLLGEGWEGRGRRVRNYVIHPEHGETRNTLALIQLRSPVRDSKILHLCPPPERLRQPIFYVVKFDDNYETLQKRVIPMEHVPAKMCQEFYVAAKLYERKMRPPHVTCAISLESMNPCVWEAGAALVARDIWGRWMLLGLGVRGPGCGAPSRYLDMASYFPWVRDSLDRFQRLTISKITDQQYVLRTAWSARPGEKWSFTQRFGACDAEEKINLIYRDFFNMQTDSTDEHHYASYNMTIFDNVAYSCLTLELKNASATSYINVKHMCPRYSYGPACHTYRGTVFEIRVYMKFTASCWFELNAWGWHKNMTLIDIHEWKWEEGTYYEDFRMIPEEYIGPTYMTEFGFEPVDTKYWVPEYNVWQTSTPPPPKPSTTRKPDEIDDLTMHEGYYLHTTPETDIKVTKPPFKKKPTPGWETESDSDD
ncbi:uncharacterized protein isoform X2 [Choristoneura fumiferana]|uniref:uncharacterized protein isoform X2 n=1 Tax=Choristoneura fumiferana TaxID=7141 RepID=UPI003D159F7B